MAFTKSLVTQTVFGNRRVYIYNITADSSAGSIATEDTRPIIFASVIPLQQTSFIASGNTSQTNMTWTENQGATGTTIKGTLALTGVVSTNKYRAIVYK